LASRPRSARPVVDDEISLAVANLARPDASHKANPAEGVVHRIDELDISDDR